MIRSQAALTTALQTGRTICRLTGFSEAGWRWVTTDTNEPVHGTAVRCLLDKGVAAVIARDLGGEPYQIGPAS